MANWQDSTSFGTISYSDDYGSYLSGKMKVSLQYDADSDTVTSCRVRFKLTSSDNYGTDSVHILYDANSSTKRTLLKIKEPGEASWPYYSPSFTLTKAHNAANFTVQDFWICNNGNNATTVSASNFASVFSTSGARKNLVYRQASKTMSGYKTSPVTAGTVTITDNKNNTFTVTGKIGTAGTNNPTTGARLYWGVNVGGNVVWETQGCPVSFTSGSKTVTPSVVHSANETSPLWQISTTPQRQVFAKVVTYGKYGDPVTKQVDGMVNQYWAPTSPGVPTLTSGSFKNGRLTTKTTWQYLWTPATAKNTPSAVRGYRIRLYQNGNLVKGLAYSKGILTKTTGTNEYVDTGSTANSAQISPTSNGFSFKAGDTIKMSVYAYSIKDGNSVQLFSTDSKPSNVSAETTVQNNGIMRVNIGNGVWKEGQVYVNIGNGVWKEATSVYVNIGGGVWKESI